MIAPYHDLNVLPKPKLTLLPVLTVLFLISYLLMTYLIVEQGRIIESQKGLIQSLLGDSLELTHMKGKAIQERNAQAKAQAEAQAQAQSHSSSSQAQSQAPSSQGKQRDHAKSNNGSGKIQKRAPEKPPKAASDDMDARRVLISI